MDGTPHANGGSKLVWWILTGVFAPIVLSILGLTITTTQSNAQRLGVVETENRQLKHTLNRLENKMDRLLELWK